MSVAEELQHKLGYKFSNPQLLVQALSHRSIGRPNNERLEYLGDSVVGFYIAQYLFHRYAHHPEGELTRLRASLVNKTSLAGLARTLRLQDHLRMGQGEMKSGGFNRDSVLSDALEAVVGAVYLDGGTDVVFGVLDELYAPLKEEISALPAKDNKSTLQEFLQKRERALPVYQLISQDGDPHAPVFTVNCSVDGAAKAFEGVGNSRKIAEQLAAAEALKWLQQAEKSG